MSEIKRFYSMYFEEKGDNTPHGWFEFTIMIAPKYSDRYFYIQMIWAVDSGREITIDDLAYADQQKAMRRLAEFSQKVVAERRQIELELIAEKRLKTFKKNRGKDA